ncbi:MAG: primosomal protein N' [Oscillospiraceae bacterium]|nr:primosomal protein N' [Oscillospiraceae bacterium]
MPIIAKIAVEKTSYHFDRLFSYSVPDSFEVVPGMRVVVPFGGGNSRRQGLVFEIADETDQELKDIVSVIDRAPVLSAQMLELAEYLTETTFCTYYDAVKTILPRGFHYEISEKYCLAVKPEEIDQDGLSSQELLFIQNLDRNPDLSAYNNRRIVLSLLQKGIIRSDESLRRRLLDSSDRMVRIRSDNINRKFTPKQQKVIDLLTEYDSAPVKEICTLCDVTSAVVTSLAKKNAVEIYNKEVFRTPYDDITEIYTDEIVLTENQQRIYDSLVEMSREDKPRAALLRGVTGSGKTQVFLRLIDHITSGGKTAIMLVPEISLTPQVVSLFKRRFGREVAVIHSGLSPGERMDEFKRIERGEVSIVVGTRSAVFAPLDNIGIIIMDEEGESSYKSDSSPRYHAREIAKFRSARHNALLLMASATPSIESYHSAVTGRYALFELDERYKGAILPQVDIIDLRLNQTAETAYNPVSDILTEELRQNLAANRQSILLINRRGFNAFAACASCMQVVKCPHCSVSLTYHKTNDSLVCHYCSYSCRFSSSCGLCGYDKIRLWGLGTQRIEDTIQQLLPDARILRMDADTTYSRTAFREKFGKFSAGHYDILIGTQMIAKGLDFHNVTLVGVLAIDGLLFSGDYKSSERVFSLITQVVGRSGRGEKKGKAYIQTYTPEHPVICRAAEQNYKEFYAEEIEARKLMLYPPFCDICILGLSSVNEEAVIKSAGILLDIIKNEIDSGTKIPLRVLGPSRAIIYKLSNKYRMRILIKCRVNRELRIFIGGILRAASAKKEFAKVTLYADINGEIN